MYALYKSGIHFRLLEIYLTGMKMNKIVLFKYETATQTKLKMTKYFLFSVDAVIPHEAPVIAEAPAVDVVPEIAEAVVADLAPAIAEAPAVDLAPAIAEAPEIAEALVADLAPEIAETPAVDIAPAIVEALVDAAPVVSECPDGTCPVGTVVPEQPASE